MCEIEGRRKESLQDIFAGSGGREGGEEFTIEWQGER